VVRGALVFHDLAATDAPLRSLAPVGHWLLQGFSTQNESTAVTAGLLMHLLLAAGLGAGIGAATRRLSPMASFVLATAIGATAYFVLAHALGFVPGAQTRPLAVTAPSRLAWGLLFALAYARLHPVVANLRRRPLGSGPLS
jgi:hypothetical protein